jgi:hypothetical protein
MVVKAMSWALRALAVPDPTAVVGFLEAHAAELAPRVLREVRNKIRTGSRRRSAPRRTEALAETENRRAAGPCLPRASSLRASRDANRWIPVHPFLAVGGNKQTASGGWRVGENKARNSQDLRDLAVAGVMHRLDTAESLAILARLAAEEQWATAGPAAPCPRTSSLSLGARPVFA